MSGLYELVRLACTSTYANNLEKINPSLKVNTAWNRLSHEITYPRFTGTCFAMLALVALAYKELPALVHYYNKTKQQSNTSKPQRDMPTVTTSIKSRITSSPSWSTTLVIPSLAVTGVCVLSALHAAKKMQKLLEQLTT